MATRTVMQGLWGLIESMSLTQSNRRWLADKLIMPAPAKTKAKPMTPAQAAVTRLEEKSDEKFSKEDRRILEGFYDAIQEWKEIKAGRKQTIPDDIAMAQLRKELEEEGYVFD